jgi:hypothetical protein
VIGAALLLGIASPVVLSAASGPGGKSESLTDLGPVELLAPPTSPAEAPQVALTRYAIENGALSHTFDPETGVHSILFPMGSHPEPPRTELPVRIVIARYARAEYDAVVAAVAARDWAPGADRYVYGISIDAAAGVVAVDTTAPATITAALEARYPGILRLRRVAWGRPAAPGRPARRSARLRVRRRRHRQVAPLRNAEFVPPVVSCAAPLINAPQRATVNYGREPVG